jgi:GNAT superfamily N-acetyltransferase
MTLVRLGASDVGGRVVVRHRLPDTSATDLVGDLLRLDERELVVLPDDGPEVLVRRADVVAAKPVPARVVRPTSAADAVQRVADLGWPGLERRRLGGWVLRAGNGFTGRANSALAVGDPGVPLADAVAQVEAFYAERRLPARVQVPFGLSSLPAGHEPTAELDALLAARGWTHDEPTLLMTADLRGADLRGANPPVPVPAGTTVDVAPEPDAQWLEQYRYRGGGLPAGARDVLLAAPWQRFVSVRRAGRTVAVGRVAVARGWAGVTAMTVDAGERRQGLGGWLLQRLLAEGTAEGARFAYLQVMQSHAAAVELYRGHGFTPHHRYHYRTAQPA